MTSLLRRQYSGGALLALLFALGFGLAMSVKLSNTLQSAWPVTLYSIIMACFVGAAALLTLGLLIRALPVWLQIPVHAIVLRRAMRTLGFQFPWWKCPAEDVGVVDGLQVRLSRPRLGRPGQPLRISVVGIPAHFEIETEGLRRRVSKALGVREIVTGDPAFDRKLFVRGRAGDRTLAALDADTRRAILELAERWTIKIAHGRVRLTTWLALTSSQALVGAVQAAVALALRPAWRRRPAAGLAENARLDPLPEVRLNNLAAVRHGGSSGRQALRAAMGDPDEKVRARAALWLGREGRSALEALVSSATLDVDCVVNIIHGMGEELGEQRSLAILEEASRLDRRPVAVALIEALGARGSVVAVPALRAVAAAHALDFGLSHAAQRAVSRIQSRLSGAEAGQLAVADSEAGALSLTDGCGGRLSLETAPRPEGVVECSGQHVGAERKRQPE